jgi:hypothetical protein
MSGPWLASTEAGEAARPPSPRIFRLSRIQRERPQPLPAISGVVPSRQRRPAAC